MTPWLNFFALLALSLGSVAWAMWMQRRRPQ